MFCSKKVNLNTDLLTQGLCWGKEARVNTSLTRLDYVLKDFLNHIVIAHVFPVSVAG